MGRVRKGCLGRSRRNAVRITQSNGRRNVTIGCSMGVSMNNDMILFTIEN